MVVCERIERSYASQRSGDVIVVIEARWLVRGSTGATHIASRPNTSRESDSVEVCILYLNHLIVLL